MTLDFLVHQSGRVSAVKEHPASWGAGEMSAEFRCVLLDLVAMPDDYLIEVEPGVSIWASEADGRLVEG